MSESAKVWRSPVLTNLEILHGAYRTHTFARHVHEEFCIAAIMAGSEAVKYSGETLLAPAGSLVVLHPDEAHCNWAADETGWSFKVFYPPIPLMQQIAQTVPFFSQPVIDDRALFRQVMQFHNLLEQNIDRLKLESRFTQILATLVNRYAQIHPCVELKPDSQLVQQIKQYLQMNYSGNPSLEQLSQICGVSPFHLNRVFRDAVGLPPHAYLTHFRITQVKAQLHHSISLAQIAIETGFTDQSHLTKTFKAWVGVTSGQYRSQIHTGASC